MAKVKSKVKKSNKKEQGEDILTYINNLANSKTKKKIKKEFSKILKVYQDEIVERCEEEKRDKNRTRSRRKINDEYRPQFYAVDKIRHREAIYGKKHKSIKKFGKKIKKITPLFRTIGKLVANSIVNLLNNDGLREKISVKCLDKMTKVFDFAIAI